MYELKFTRKAAAPMVAKLLDSAISNAKQLDENVDLDTLRIEACYADKAPNRHMAPLAAHVRRAGATRVVKGMSHITLTLSDESQATKKQGKN